MTLTIDLTPAEIRRAGWEALISQLGVVKSLRFLLEYERGQGNYTELRRELFAEKTVSDILADMAEEGIISKSSLIPTELSAQNTAGEDLERGSSV